MVSKANQDMVGMRDHGMGGTASHILNRCLTCLAFPVICVCNAMFAMLLVQSEDVRKCEAVIIVVMCCVFCLHALFVPCCCPPEVQEEEEDVSEEEEDKNKESNSKGYVIRLDRGISRSVVIEMGF